MEGRSVGQEGSKQMEHKSSQTCAQISPICLGLLPFPEEQQLDLGIHPNEVFLMWTLC